jgi:hypothetical protein
MKSTSLMYVCLLPMILRRVVIISFRCLLGGEKASGAPPAVVHRATLEKRAGVRKDHPRVSPFTPTLIVLLPSVVSFSSRPPWFRSPSPTAPRPARLGRPTRAPCPHSSSISPLGIRARSRSLSSSALSRPSSPRCVPPSLSLSYIGTAGLTLCSFLQQLHPTRQRLTTEEGKALTDADRSLDHYGVSEQDTLYLKDLGRQISWKTVFLVEYVSGGGNERG